MSCRVGSCPICCGMDRICSDKLCVQPNASGICSNWSVPLPCLLRNTLKIELVFANAKQFKNYFMLQTSFAISSVQPPSITIQRTFSSWMSHSSQRSLVASTLI